MSGVVHFQSHKSSFQKLVQVGTRTWYKGGSQTPNVPKSNSGQPYYRAPIVSNGFAVVNNDAGRRMMQTWWQSAGRITKMDNSRWSGRRFLWDWPWEQERLAACYDTAPGLFFDVNQSWTYMGWMHHGPLSGVAFQWKHDIIRSLNETLMDQTRTFSLHNGSSYEELVSDLYQQIDARPLRTEVGQLSPCLTGFWDADWGRA